MSSVVTEFPDQTYTTSNKPSVETLKSDIAALETGHNDLQSAAVLLTGTQSVTGVKTMTTPVLESPVVKAWSGWQLYSAVTPTYTSADDPTYVITFAGVDLTSIMSVGMKVKFTNNSTTFYGFITAIAFSTDTTVTLYGGTDYDVANSAISGFYFSTDRCPQGFPMDPTKWTVTTTDTSQRQKLTPTQNVWDNTGTLSITIPIGCWSTEYFVMTQIKEASATQSSVYQVTLSTANNSESDADLTRSQFLGGASGTLDLIIPSTNRKNLTLAAKTPYYLNQRTQSASIDELDFRGDLAKTIIRAVCAYL